MHSFCVVDCSSPTSEDTMAEWLRRRMQVPLGSARAGSNPARVDIFLQMNLLC